MQSDQHDFGTGIARTGKVNEGPVICLGMTFENDEARRAHFTEELRKKLRDPEFRKIEGFPIGRDEDILNLSDPPYYTACPNPWIADFIAEWEAQKPEQPEGPHYHREPFAADVSEGKRDPLYEHYSYHTKVPHLAIARYIEHFTDKGDIVLDGFSGSGMTGLAGKVLDQQPSASFQNKGGRNVILSDLSTYASFIGYNYSNHRCDHAFFKEVEEIERDLSWMYKTKDENGKERTVNYFVWSDVFTCSNCGDDVIFFDRFVDQTTGEVVDESSCNSCGSKITKRSLSPKRTTIFDNVINEAVEVLKQVPVLITYFIGKKQHEKRPDSDDLSLIEKINSMKIDSWVPIQKLREGDNTIQPIKSHGISYSHMFFTKRNLICISRLWEAASAKNMLFWMFEILGGFRVWSKRSIFLTKAWKQGGTGAFKPSTSGILYVPSISGERNVLASFKERIKKGIIFSRALPKSKTTVISSTGSSSDFSLIPDNSIDYIFVDPPFGGNIMYSELNLVFEPWIGVITQNKPEAICNKSESKDVLFYTEIMVRCFSEFNRVLKPGRWMTVEFHNSKNAIWNSIQEALLRSGFVIADVRTLDKKQGTFKQYTNANTVKQDLVISAYSPSSDLEQRFSTKSGTEDGVWDFVRNHLKQLPVFVGKGGIAEAIVERQNYLLFDRMVAYHVQHGVSVPISSSEFYAGLTQRFSERDEMYFLAEQVAEYDKGRISCKEMMQTSLFVRDESSAIQWLRKTLKNFPHTYQEIHPLFTKETQRSWSKNELSLELSTLLEQNFLRYDGKGPVPEQIHAYLSTNWKELRNLPKNDPTLVAKARDRWYLPDPNKSGDLEKLREKALLREFEEYKGAKKKLKVFRLEAVRAGFKKAWQERDYAVIVAVASNIPNNVLEEDSKLLMWYDQAVTRMGGE
ncbi:DNA methyltransferase [Nitratidesulfovibrio liaohensis]|uniref:Site-specific DNA-methyltransferase n=1 Tax=Nitratidesulfovibrio liaohensis TaxID=2604158 RepID=A0ABY9R6V4_9BACT|nr:DNA methyltransferase [Nitratidesulfovibrio liaohensis]WMW66937.1 site-specific DNA-methyltransferase [Nitratidesulfovibrio liaohensis]